MAQAGPTAATAATASSADPSSSRHALEVRTAEELQKMLDPHKELVMLVQDVLCFRRPYLSAAYVIGCHGLWFYLMLSARPFMVKVSILCLLGVLGDAAWRAFRTRPDLLAHIPQLPPLPAHAMAHLNGEMMLPLRSLPELCRDVAHQRLRVGDFFAWCNQKHEDSPGHLTFLLVILFYACALLFNQCSTATATYAGLLAALSFPFLERCKPARALVAPVGRYISRLVTKFVDVTDRLFRHLPDRVLHIDPDAAARVTATKALDESYDQDSMPASPMPPQSDSPAAAVDESHWSELDDTMSASMLADAEELTRGRGWSLLNDTSDAHLRHRTVGARGAPSASSTPQRTLGDVSEAATASPVAAGVTVRQETYEDLLTEETDDGFQLISHSDLH